MHKEVLTTEQKKILPLLEKFFENHWLTLKILITRKKLFFTEIQSQ